MRGIFDIYSKWHNILHKQQFGELEYVFTNDTHEPVWIDYEWQKRGCVKWVILYDQDGEEFSRTPVRLRTSFGLTVLAPDWSIKLVYEYNLLEWIKQNGEVIIHK